MAFSKLYKVLMDSPVGFQSVNQAGLNNAEMRTQMYVEHGSREFWFQLGVGRGAPALPDYAQSGRHNLIEIPRTVATTVFTSFPVAGTTMSLGWAGVGVSAISRVSTGFYQLTILGLSTWWATATCLAGTGSTYLPPIVRPFYPSAANGNTAGLWVSTYALDTGDFVPVDSSFTLALYGTVP